MRLVAGTFFTLLTASLLIAQQNAAPGTAAAQGTPATSQAPSQPATQNSPAAPQPTSAVPPQGVIERQQLVIQKDPNWVPVAVATQAQPSPSATPVGARQQAAPTQTGTQPQSAATQPANTAPGSATSPQKAQSPAAHPDFQRQPVVIEKDPDWVPMPVAVAAAPSSPTTPTPGTMSPQPAPQADTAESAAQQKANANAPNEAPGVPQPPEAGAAPPPAAPGTPILPNVTKKQADEARKQFRLGLKLKKQGHLDQAYTKFTSASELDPTDLDYITAREFTREQLAYKALQDGNKAMLEHNDIVALADFRRALEYDATNEYAIQRVHDAMPIAALPQEPVSIVKQSVPLQVAPEEQHHDFHFRGDSRALLTEVSRAYGISAQFDDSVKQQHVHYDIQDVNFATAIQAAQEVTKTFWVPLTHKQILFLADTVENRRNFERMGLRTFYLPDVSDQELTEMTNSLRTLLALHFISMDKAESTITIRAEVPLLDAADRLIKSLTSGRPELLLDLRVYAVSTSLARSLGTALPTQFTMFNISPALLGGLGASAGNLINQLIAGGGINAANSTAVSALLAQLSNSSTASILTQPFVVFGGGLTLFGLSTGGSGITPTFSLNTSDIKELDHLTLRTSHNDAAVAKIGERYPIINATFAPIYNTSAISSVIGNNSYIAPFPSFTFEDLGLNLKATPYVHGDSDVTLKIELQLRSLGTQNVNGIPIINNREYSGQITVKDGESSVVTGMIDMSDTRSISGYPFLGSLPAVTYAASVHSKNVTEDELLVVITPHVVRLAEQNAFAIELPPAH